MNDAERSGHNGMSDIDSHRIIGVAEPVSLMVNTFGTETTSIDKIQIALRETFQFKPAELIKSLDYQYLLPGHGKYQIK